MTLFQPDVPLIDFHSHLPQLLHQPGSHSFESADHGASII